VNRNFQRWRRIVTTTLAISSSLLIQARAQTTNSPTAEIWATNAVQFPIGTATNSIRRGEFDNLHVEAVARKLKVVWPKGDLPESAKVTLIASADDFGHWPARDWRTFP
jgi:phytoene/squalene synthetase